VPRFTQREHVGFSLEHLTFDAAQAWQLSRSLWDVEVATLDQRLEPEEEPGDPVEGCTSVMAAYSEATGARD
jgi:hypothetical protein